MKCHAVDDPAPRNNGDPEYTARVLETAQYEWNTTSGCKKYPFDRMAFAKRCLRAKAGLTYVLDYTWAPSWARVEADRVGISRCFIVSSAIH